MAIGFTGRKPKASPPPHPSMKRTVIIERDDLIFVMTITVFFTLGLLIGLVSK